MSARFRRIVVGVDGSDAAADALEWTLDMARMAGSEVVAVFALAPPSYLEYQGAPLPPVELDLEWQGEMKKLFETNWCRPLSDSGISYRTVVRDGRPAEVIAELAEAEDADLVVVGRRGRGQVAELLLGSVSHQLSHHCGRPLVIVSHDKSRAAKEPVTAGARA